MKKLILFCILACLSSFYYHSKEESSILEKIKKRNYFFEVKRKQTNTDWKGSIQEIIKHDSAGVLFRQNDFYNFRSERFTGIQEDSLFLTVDQNLKMIFFGRKEDMGISILLMLFDPYDMVLFAEQKQKTKQMTVKNNKIQEVYSLDDFSALRTIALTYWDKGDSTNYLVVSLDYLQRTTAVHDEFLFKLIDTGKISYRERIEDYINKGDGKYSLQKKYENYDFTNFLKILY